MGNFLSCLSVGVLDGTALWYAFSMFTHARSNQVLKADRVLMMVMAILFVLVGAAWSPAFHGSVLIEIAAALGFVVCGVCFVHQTLWLRDSVHHD